MGNRSIVIILALVGLCLRSVISAEPDPFCPGPLKYYEELGCTPIFNNSTSKCPKRFDCDNLKELPTDKCFANGHAYNVGDKLRNEDRNPCDIGCFCSRGSNGPKFICANNHCRVDPPTPGCYLQRHSLNCCPGPEICPKDPEDRPTCLVDGKTYRDGEYFQPEGEPTKHCYCGPGYTAENSEQYCVPPKIAECGWLLHHSDDIRKNCAPVYYVDQFPSKNCTVLSQCEREDHVVLPLDPPIIAEPDMLCKLGTLTMAVGDTLYEKTDNNRQRPVCVCEVPPVPTCFVNLRRRL